MADGSFHSWISVCVCVRGWQVKLRNLSFNACRSERFRDEYTHEKTLYNVLSKS